MTRAKIDGGKRRGRERIGARSVLATSLLLVFSLSLRAQTGPEVCETVCAMEARCNTLGTPDEEDWGPYCLESCRSPLFDPGIRGCLAEAEDCEGFTGCMEPFAAEGPPIEPMSQPASLPDDASLPKVSCPGIKGGCTYPLVCCTEIYGSRGHNTKVHVCGERHCPPKCLIGFNPFCLRCGCPSKHDAYPGWPPPPAEELGLGYSEGRLLLIYKADQAEKDKPDKRYYVASSSDGTHFSESRAVPGVKSDYGPSLAADGGGLVMAYKDSRHSKRTFVVFVGISPDTEPVFSERIRVAGAHSPKPPAIAWFDGQYRVVFRPHHKSHPLNIVSSTDGRGREWGEPRKIEGQASRRPPALAVLGKQLVMAYVPEDDSSRIVVSRTSDLESWESTTLEVGSAANPALAAFQDRLFLAFSSPDDANALRVASSKDGSEFSETMHLGGQSSPGPIALAAAPERLYLGYKANDPTNSLYITSTGDGTNWDRKIHLGGDTTP